MNKNTLIWSIVLAAIFIGGIFFMSMPAAVNSSGNAVKDVVDGAPAKEFTMKSFTEIIDGKYFPKFSPNEIKVKKGDRVRIKITNIKGTHDFKIDEFNVYTETPLDQEMTVEFVADKAGRFEYYCTKPGHRQNGHWGTLIVEE